MITLGERRVAGGELPSWRVAELREPPRPGVLAMLTGPAAALVAVSVGRADGVLGPLLFGRYGIAILAVIAVAIAIQALLVSEMSRYSLATGEPIFTAYLRTKPGRRVWGPVYAILTVAQVGHLGRALLAFGGLGAIGAIASGLRAAEPGSLPVIAVVAVVLTIAVLSVGSRIARNVELAAAILVGAALLLLVVLATAFGRPDANRDLSPLVGDIGLLAGFAYLVGGSGVVTAAYTSWGRDEGRGMAAGTGFIVAVTEPVRPGPAPLGAVFEPSPEANARFRGWRSVVEREMWTVYAVGAFAGAALWILAVPATAAGANVLVAAGIALLLARSIVSADTFARLLSELLRAGSVSRWARELDPKRAYYVLIALLAAVSVVLVTTARAVLVPLFYVEVIAANLATAMLCAHTVVANRRLLSRPLRAPLWRDALLMGGALFFLAVTTAAVVGSVAFTRFFEGAPIRF